MNARNVDRLAALLILAPCALAWVVAVAAAFAIGREMQGAALLAIPALTVWAMLRKPQQARRA